MERCQKLKAYAQFIDIIRHYLRENEHLTNEQAISKAIDDCIKNNILRDILQKERLRVMASILSEFDEVGYKEMIKEEAYEDAYEEVYEEVCEEISVKSLIEFTQDTGYSKQEVFAIIKQRFHLSDDVINQYMQKFWKN